MALKAKKPIPFDFVLEALTDLEPRTNPMFGCTAVYIGSLLVFILRDREASPRDRGVWVATSGEYHESLRRELPSLRDLEIFGPGPTNWQVLPVSESDFEESVLRACDMVLARDERIGRIPKSKLRKGSGPKTKSKAKPALKPEAAKKSKKTALSPSKKPKSRLKSKPSRAKTKR